MDANELTLTWVPKGSNGTGTLTAMIGTQVVHIDDGNINKADFRPIEEGCDCFACRHFTRAYLRHLLKAGEILGLRMLSVHNSHMFLRLMKDIRAHIAAGTFAEFRRAYAATYVPTQKVLAGRALAALER